MPKPARTAGPIPVAADQFANENTELAVSIVAAGAARRPPRKAVRAASVVAGTASLVLALFLLLAALARPADGVVSLDTSETDVQIVLLDRGREAAVLNRKTTPEVRLKPGEYEVEVRKGGDGLRLWAERVTVEAGGRQVVRLTREVLGSPISPGALVCMPPRLPDLVGWTLETREHRGPIKVAALSADGKWLATGSEDATVRVWSYPEAELARVLVGHTSPVSGLSWSADSQTLTSFAADKKSFVWDCHEAAYAKPASVNEADAPSQPATFAAPDNKKVSVSGGRVLILDATTNKEIKVLLQPRPAPSPIVALSVAPGGKMIASIHADQSIRVWEANSGKTVYAFKVVDAPKPLLAWSPDGKTLATSHSTLVRLWDVDAGIEAKSFDAGALNGLAWSPNGRALALAGPRLEVWEVESRQLHTVKAAPGGSVAWAPDSTAVVVADTKTTEVWDLNPDKLRVKCNRPAVKVVSGVAWSPDGKAVADAADTGTRLYDPQTGTLLQHFGLGTGTAPLVPSWSPDAKTFISGGSGKAEFHEAATYKVAHPFPVPLSGPHAWSPDGHTLAYAQGGDLRLFDADTRLPRGVILAPGTDEAVFVLATGHCQGSPAIDNEMVYVAQSERGQQTLRPAEFAKAYGWKNDTRWVRFAER